MIDSSLYSNIFVVGDLHGKYDELMQELTLVGFDFEKDGRGVTVTAPNGNKKSFITSQGGGRGGYKGQQWSSVQEFIERNKDAEAWSNKSKNTKNLERVVFDLIEKETIFSTENYKHYENRIRNKKVIF